MGRSQSTMHLNIKLSQTNSKHMPRILEAKLKKEYPHNDAAVFGTLNKIGAMKGSKETAKGKRMEKALERKKEGSVGYGKSYYSKKVYNHQ